MRHYWLALPLVALVLASCDADRAPRLTAPEEGPAFDRTASHGPEDAPFRDRTSAPPTELSPYAKLLASRLGADATTPAAGIRSRREVGAASSHIRMAYDMSHDDGRQQLGWDNYGSLRTALAARGVTVEQITDFSLATLQNYNVLWLEEEFEATLTRQEAATLIAYLLLGGSVIVCCEDWPEDPLSPPVLLGFPYVDHDEAEGVSTDITPHPITFRVSSVLFDGHDDSFIVPRWGVSLVRAPTEGDYDAVASAFGRIVVMADEICHDPNFSGESNAALCTQAVLYLGRL